MGESEKTQPGSAQKPPPHSLSPTPVPWASASELARRIARGELSSVEVVEAHIRRIEEVNPQLNAVVVPLYEQARMAAKEADRARMRHQLLGPLHGVPITVKECYHVAGTASSIGVDRFREEILHEDGPLVRRLRRAGAIILGKTNVPQAMLLHETDNPIYGRTNNPWDLSRSPGGSSGGEAAIIATGGSPLGLANDLGGSIRQPAHVCGICGIKPTAGRHTNRGCRNNLSGLKLIATQSGAMARHSADLWLALQVLNIRGADEPRLDDEIDQPLGNPQSIDVAKLRIGIFDDDGFFRASPAIRRAVHEAGTALRSAGADVVEFRPPDVHAAMSLYFALIGADGARALGQVLDGNRIDWRIARLMRIARVDQPWRALLAGIASIGRQPRTSLLLRSTGFKTAEQMSRLAGDVAAYADQFASAMDAGQIDALVFPPHSLVAPPHGSTFDLPPAASYCFVANLLGIPAGCVPVTRVRPGEETDRRAGLDQVERAAHRVELGSAGLPVGVQVAARHWREDLVLAVMETLEAAFRGRADYPNRPEPVDRRVLSNG